MSTEVLQTSADVYSSPLMFCIPVQIFRPLCRSAEVLQTGVEVLTSRGFQ